MYRRRRVCAPACGVNRWCGAKVDSEAFDGEAEHWYTQVHGNARQGVDGWRHARFDRAQACRKAHDGQSFDRSGQTSPQQYPQEFDLATWLDGSGTRWREAKRWRNFGR
jgi:hypothetical protein